MIFDASEKAYCAVVYLVLEASSGYFPVLLTSKTRVAPLSRQSIPRLELPSGVILTRPASSVREALQSQTEIDKTYLWLDSKTAISWIQGSKEWKQYVQNHVNEILSLSEKSMCHLHKRKEFVIQAKLQQRICRRTLLQSYN